MFFGRRSVMRTALTTLLLLAAASGRAEAPEPTPFSEVFAQLATRLVGVVVNISTTQATASSAPKGGPEAQLPAPGAPLDEFFRDFFGEKERRAVLIHRARGSPRSAQGSSSIPPA